ncbi:hypothetical protein [Hydrocarboniphaga effusa]|uniref:hypothetical protein n=1 Tax=Hydrocarboniphaga effusa TaxID=243629 RepID=UPI003BAD4BE3
MNEHLRILDLATRNALPAEIDDQSDPSAQIFRELLDAGYVTAIDASSFDGEAFLNPRITLAGREYLNERQAEADAGDQEVIGGIERIRGLLISVATGGPQINSVNESYRDAYGTVDAALRRKGIKNTIPYQDLWDWHGRWKQGDLKTYQSRREFVSALINPLLSRVRGDGAGGLGSLPEPTGWPRVDRTITEIRRRLGEASTEEQFQAVGLLCREALISLAQAVHDPAKHPPLDEKKPSETDAKRMLEAYIAVELGGSSHEAARRHAKAAYDLAVDLQHRRTATFRQAAMCAEATISAVNVVAIVSGHRDPK